MAVVNGGFGDDGWRRVFLEVALSGSRSCLVLTAQEFDYENAKVCHDSIQYLVCEI
jgi:hypothetical protein